MIAAFLSLFCAFAAEVRVLDVRGAIDPGSADYVVRGVADAEAAGAAAVIIRLDTPGGLVESAREIVQAELTARVPVVVYVSPSGARAASAGLFVTIAASVAAMAPGTTIGAAHPVQLGGEPPAEAVEAKALEDTAAWARTVARQRGRNVTWAERAVRESIAATGEEALALGVIDLLADDLEGLLAALDGRVVSIDGQPVSLSIAGATLREVPMTVRQRVVHALANPSLVFLLVTIGMFGIYVELLNPGLIVPGALGVVLLLAAAVGLAILPFNAAGLAFLVGGLVLFGLEVAVGSSGLLALTGAAALAFGGVLLFDRVPGLDLRVDPRVLIGVVVFVAVAAFGLAVQVARAQRRRVVTGAEGLVAQEGVVLVGGADTGRVRVFGEDWGARWTGALLAGTRVRVVAVRGLQLDVEPVLGGDT